MFCKHTEGSQHDCAYVEARNRLVPLAEKMATTLLGDIDPGKFHAAMTWLWSRREQSRVREVARLLAEEDEE